ncbi:MAG: M20/M25/M40 family metallo-hydrolase, partial [Bacteroidetes bacterium]
MKYILHLLVLTFFTFSPGIPFSAEAQTFDQVPAIPLTGTWYSETPSPKHNATRYLNPLIVSMINQVSPDSMKAVIQHLQDYGTRYPLNSNRKEIAEWLLQRFRSYGYTEVQLKLDSFTIVSQGAPVWQYNVVCTLLGTSATSEEYHIGGHYDSYCSGDPMILAPGADDNATATASVLEVARVIKKMNYSPEATIKFNLWAAEELGLYGSKYYAGQARLRGDDIRYYLNLDMVSNNPLNKKEVKIYRYQGVEWAGLLAADIFQRYTGLNVFFPNQLVASGSDSYSYWLNNFPAAYLEEMYFSPNWHRPSDTLGNCNIPYLADITKGALAVIMEQQFLPSPVGIYAKSSRENIRLGWKPTKNTNVSGYNLYRSDTTGSGFVKINSTAIADSSYYDSSIIPGKLYYYHLTVLNDSAQESMPSSEVSGARFNFTDSLLVLAALKGNVFTPDSVLAFYTGILDSIPFRWFDFSQTHQPGLNTISHYQSILFLINDFSVDPPDQNLLQVLRIFFDNGGNMLFSGFQPTGYFDNTTGYPRKLSPESFSRTYFKADSVNFKFNSIMNRANAAFPGYDTLYTDTHKTLDPSFPGEIFNIEVFA